MKLSIENKRTLANRYCNVEPVTKLIAETGIPRSTLYHWIKLYKSLKSVVNHPETENDFKIYSEAILSNRKFLS